MSPPFQPDGRHSAVAAREWVGPSDRARQPYFEWMHRNSQGEEIPCEVHVVRLPSPAQQTDSRQHSGHHGAKHAEEALRESEARYRGLVNNATYGIYWVTLEGDLLDANPAMVQMLGYESIEEFLDIDNTAAPVLRFGCARRGGEPLSRARPRRRHGGMETQGWQDHQRAVDRAADPETFVATRIASR